MTLSGMLPTLLAAAPESAVHASPPSGGALTMMIVVQVSVTLITGYFFLKVLRTPPSIGEDSYAGEEE